MKEITFLMWNLNRKGKSFIPAIEEVYKEHLPDILLLSETDLDDEILENISNKKLIKLAI